LRCQDGAGAAPCWRRNAMLDNLSILFTGIMIVLVIYRASKMK
jgi:hypothetical protein